MFRSRNHSSIERFEKWKRGMKPSEKFPKGFVFTPKYMMRGMNNMEWIDWKKEQTDKVADIYKDEEKFLNSNPKPKASIKVLSISKKVETVHPIK